LYCVFVLFRLCIFILICFVCTSVRTTATEWKSNYTLLLLLLIIIIIIIIITNKLRTKLSWVRIPVELKDLPLLQNIETISKAHPASYSVGTGVASTAIKRPGRDVNNSPISNAEVKNRWSYISIPLIRLHGVGDWNILGDNKEDISHP
jgi:hypothetical protein